MVLHEIAQGAGLVVVAGARADAEVLGARDLDVVDEVPVPDRLEHHVREPEGHHVLDGLLAQVVVDPEDLALAERVVDDVLQRAGRLEVGAERLLDDAADVDPGMAVQARFLDLLDDHREELGRGGEVVVAVERLSGLLVERVEHLLELRVAGTVVERERDVPDVAEQRRENLLVGLAARELLDRLARLGLELLVGPLPPGHADQLEALRQRALVGEVVERGQQLAVRQVAGGAEDHQRGGRDRQPLEAFDQRVLERLLERVHGHRVSRRRPCARPRGRRTAPAAPPARGACSRPPRASRSARTARRP